MRSIKDIAQFSKEIQHFLGSILIHQVDLIDLFLIALFSRGHLLLIGPPGIAKTRSAHVFARLLDLEFHRIQFTPDLLPSDIL